MRKSSLFLLTTAALVLLTGLMIAHAAGGSRSAGSAFDDERRMVRELGLTDLCLSTEANYTRHLTQSDLHTPFQDHPTALEHFPSGSLLFPPLDARRLNGHLVRTPKKRP